MKYWKKIGVLLAFFSVLATTSIKAQSNNKEIVIIRTMEMFGAMGKYTAEMVVIKPDGEKHILPLKKGGANTFGEDAGENGAVIQSEILKWSKSGFEITSFSTDGGEAFTRTFIIMTKETN